MSVNHIAVYGSLRRGGEAERLMADCKYLGKDTVIGKLYSLSWYPGIKLGFDDNTEEGTVVVDVFELPNEEKLRAKCLEYLDRYEGYDPENVDVSLFVRKTTLLERLNEEVLIYEYKPTIFNGDKKLVKDGDWLNVKKN